MDKQPNSEEKPEPKKISKTELLTRGNKIKKLFGFGRNKSKKIPETLRAPESSAAPRNLYRIPNRVNTIGYTVSKKNRVGIVTTEPNQTAEQSQAADAPRSSRMESPALMKQNSPADYKSLKSLAIDERQASSNTNSSGVRMSLFQNPPKPIVTDEELLKQMYFGTKRELDLENITNSNAKEPSQKNK
ncbi:hypothetical protein O3M35_005569 [Rhynocoris fuscipes]|uniref:Uncharacterized protein n=1 Tax=Rhynocoris fuscipes TaxID=488301 RepID=A0AAW1DJ45_9HEMI